MLNSTPLFAFYQVASPLLFVTQHLKIAFEGFMFNYTPLQVQVLKGHHYWEALNFQGHY